MVYSSYIEGSNKGCIKEVPSNTTAVVKPAYRNVFKKNNINTWEKFIIQQKLFILRIVRHLRDKNQKEFHDLTVTYQIGCPGKDNRRFVMVIEEREG